MAPVTPHFTSEIWKYTILHANADVLRVRRDDMTWQVRKKWLEACRFLAVFLLRRNWRLPAFSVSR